jgi:hypothetical protein
MMTFTQEEIEAVQAAFVAARGDAERAAQAFGGMRARIPQAARAEPERRIAALRRRAEVLAGVVEKLGEGRP